MRNLPTLAPILATALLASSCAGSAQPGATPAPTAATVPTEEPSTPASDDAGELRPGAWVEVFTQADCLDVHALPQLTEEKVACLPPGFVGMLADEPAQLALFRPTWWPLAGQGWVQESQIRFHHVGDLPYPPPDPDVSLAGEIAFRGPGGGLWLMSADGSDSRRLSGEGPLCLKECDAPLQPRWSPNGEMIAFEAESRQLLKVMDSSGQTLFSAPWCSDPVWAPTSHLLAASCSDTPGQDTGLSIFDLDGEVIHTVTRARITNWASDGRRLALVHTPTVTLRAPVVPAIFDVASGELTPLDDEMDYSALVGKGTPLWSPVGPWLAYDHRLTNVDTGDMRQLPGRIDDWSPDGRFLLLDDTQVYALEKGQIIGELEMPVPPSWPPVGPEVLTRRLFAWSPDGQLAVQFIRPADPEGPLSVLRVIELESGRARTIAMTAPPSEPELSPDGRYLVFSTKVALLRQPEGKWLWLVRLDGSGLTLLAEGMQPAWRPQP